MTASEGKREGVHVMSALVENEFGVLARIASLFAARGFNIDSLTVGPTHDESISRMTILVKGSATVIEQVKKQLNKLIEVVTVQDLTETGSHITRELMLVKVRQISLVAASSVGKWPRVLMILRTRAFRLSMALVV